MMTDNFATRPAVPWLALIVLGGFWIVVSRMLSPQWSVYAQYNYGWAVPFLCLYLLWLRWRSRPEPDKTSAVGPVIILLCAAGLFLPARIIAEANPIWRAGSWAMALLLVGMTLSAFQLIGGRNWLRHFGFPVLFFLVAVPWPSALESAMVQTLMRLNTGAVVEILALSGVPALPRGNVIEISTGLVGIDEACSGIRSLQATLMMSLFFGEFYRLKAAGRIWLVVVGVALALVCNAARTFILVWVCNRSGLDALDRWHDPTGIGILLACFAGLWLAARKFSAYTAPAKMEPSLSPRSFSKIPRFVAPGLAIWLVVVEGGTAAWFGWREQANPEISNWQIRWPANKRHLREIELSSRVRAELNFNEGRAMSWAETDGSVWQVFYFRWGPAKSLVERVRVQFAKFHRPEVCLPASGLKLRAERGVMDFSIGGMTLPFRAYEFEHRGLPLHVYYCAWEDGTRGIAANMRKDSSSRLEAALNGSRSLSQRVLEIAVWGHREAETADAALRTMLIELIEK